MYFICGNEPLPAHNNNNAKCLDEKNIIQFLWDDLTELNYASGEGAGPGGIHGKKPPRKYKL